MEWTIAVGIGLEQPVAIALRVGIAEQQHGIPRQNARFRRLGEDTNFFRQLTVQPKRNVTQADKREGRLGGEIGHSRSTRCTRRHSASRKRNVHLRTSLPKPSVAEPSCSQASAVRELLPPDHDQGIGAVGHAAPLRVVVGLELPGLAVGRHQQHLAVIEPPLRRRERGHRGIAFRLQEDLEIIAGRLGVGERQAADRLAIAAHHRPVADHLVHRFGERAGGREILQDVDALAGAAGLRKCRSRLR